MNPTSRANLYAGPCRACGRSVPAGQGVLVRGAHGGWEVYHPAHAPEPGPPARGPHTGWHRRALLAVDIAGTGTRTGVDRMLGAAVRGTEGPMDRDWVIDPGPGLDGVTGVHGSELERARADGMPAEVALEELAGVLGGQLAAKELLVAWHAPYVLTFIESELLRHGLRPLADRAPGGLFPVCDPLVLDRHADRFRAGGRGLEKVAQWYGVPHERPGEPGSDAGAALGVAQAVGACYPGLARLSRAALHAEQTVWRDREAGEAEAHDPSRRRDHRWPLGTVEALDWAPP